MKWIEVTIEEGIKLDGLVEATLHHKEPIRVYLIPDESASLPSSSVTGESEAIGFAEWLNENRWYSFDRDKQKWCYTFEHGTSLSKGVYEKNYMKTSAQLFDLYKQSKK